MDKPSQVPDQLRVQSALRLPAGQEGLVDEGDENQRECHHAQEIGVSDALVGADPRSNRLIDREQVERQCEYEEQAVCRLAPNPKEEQSDHRISHGNGAAEEIDQPASWNSP